MPNLKPVSSTTPSASPFYMLEEAARFLRLRPRTLDNMRSRGVGPIYCKHGGRVVYHRDDLESWSKSTRRHSSGEKAREVSAVDAACINNGVVELAGASGEAVLDQPDVEHASRDLSPTITARAQSR